MNNEKNPSVYSPTFIYPSMSNNNNPTAVPPPPLAAGLNTAAHQQQQQPLSSAATHSALPISAEITTTTAANNNTTSNNVPLPPPIPPSSSSTIAPPPKTTSVAPALTNVKLSSTAYYDNLKTRLLSTSSATRQEALRILTEFVNTHPLVIAVHDSSNVSTAKGSVQQQHGGGGGTISAAEYSSFLNATLPIFQSLLTSPASDTSIALAEMGSKKGSSGGTGGGGAAGSKKKKKKKGSATDNKGKDAKKKGGEKGSSGDGGKKGDGVFVAPPPLDGTASATTAAATAAADNTTKKGSGNNNNSKKSGGNNNKTTPPPPVPSSYYIPPNSSSSSIEYQIRHLILSILTKLPLTLTNTTTTAAEVSKGTTTVVAATMRPNHVHTILSMALHTLLEDYEPNALLAIQLLHKWHLHLGNSTAATSTTTSSSSSGGGNTGNTKENAKLMKECQLFFDFVMGTFKDMGKKGVNGGEAWLNQLFGVSGSTATTGTTTTTETRPALKSKQSLQVLAEIPSIIKLMFQFHSKLYKSNAVAVIPALMEGLKLTAPALNVTAVATGSSSVSNKTSPTPPKAATMPSLPSSPTSRAPVPDPTKLSSIDDTQSVTSSSTSPSLLSTSSSQQQLSPQQVQKRLYHKRTMQFLNMQIKILAYLTCLLRKAFITKPPIDVHRKYGGFKSNEQEHRRHHHQSSNRNHDPLPWASATTVSTLLRPHEEMMATIIIQLLRNCPREDATHRKELLLCTRLILSIPEFRTGFFRHIDNMLDERILVGCTTALVRGGSSGSAAITAGSTLELQGVIRPLGYTVLAEFLSFVRTKLTPAQLSRVVRIFSRLLHDTQTDVPISLQIMSVRLLLNLCEVVYLSKDPNVQVGRDLLVRILMTVVQKFRTLKDKIPKILEDAEREVEVRVRSAERVDKCMLGEEGIDGGELFRVEHPSLVVEDATFDGDYHGDPLFILRDVQSLLHPMILRMRNLFYYISTYSHHIDKEKRKANVAGEERYPLPSFVTDRDNDEVSSATMKLTQGERDIVSEFLMSGISCLKVFRMDVDPDEDPSLMKLYDKSSPSPKFREVCDTFAVIFTGLESHNFARVIAPNLPKILEEIDKDSALIGIFSSMLLDSRGVGKSHSYDLCAVVVPYILENFDMLGEYEEVPCEKGDTAGDDAKGVAPPPTLRLTNRANNLFKIFNLAFSSLMKHSKNEAAFLPHLQKLTAECLKGSTKGPFLVPNPYSNILRSIFRTISAGKFEDSYKEMHPLVTTILNELYRMYTMTSNEPFRLIIIELCLTLPTRLSVLLPHLPLLMKLVVPALQSNEGDLVNLGLRTLEFWVDNLHPDFLFPIFAQQSSTLCELMLALTHHLQPAPYPYGLLCLRLIGKLGGKNRLFLQEIMAQNRDANEWITAHQLSLQCEWLCQSSPESNEMCDDMEPKVSTSSFLLPLPLERAVEILRLVATSPNIVTKKDVKSTVQSTPIIDKHCSEVLFQDSRCLDVNSLSVELMENTKKEQSKAAFAVIKGALASVLDVNDSGVLPIDCSGTCSNEEEKIESLLEASEDADSGNASVDSDVNTAAFRRICDGLFAAAAHDGLRDEAMGLLKGVAAHVFLVVSSNEKDIIRIDSDGSTTDPFQSPDGYESSDHIDGKIKPLKPFGCFRLSGPLNGDINPFAFNQSLVDALSGCSTLAATEVIHFVIDMFRRINTKIKERNSGDNNNCKAADNEVEDEADNNKDGSVEGEGVEKMNVEETSTYSDSVVDLNGNSYGQILFEHLLSEFCLACFSKEWIARTGVMDGLILLMRKLGLGWCKHFEVALLHTAIFVVKDAPSHIANACKDAMFFFVRVTSFFYGSPASWEGSPNIHDILSPDGDSQISSPAEPVSVSIASLTLVVAEIASTNALVRFAVRHFLRVVSNDCTSLDKLLSGHVTSLKRLLFAKLLRTLSLPDLVAVVDAVAFINEAVPNLIPISDANMMSFLGELIKMICIADGEISDKNFGSVVLIDKNGWAVDSDGEPIAGNKPLVQPSSIFQRHTITLEDDNIGARIVVPEGLNLGVQLRVSTLFLFRAVVRLDEFFEAGVQTQMGNLRPHIVALLFRSLISEPPPAVLTSTSALKQALKLVEGVEDAEDASPRHRLSKELIQACIRPILVNLRDHKQLSIPLLNGLTNLLTLLSSWFNKSLGDKLLDHLQRFLEPEKIVALKLWRAGEEPLVAAAVMNLFSVLPQASNFVEALVKTTIRLESVLSAYGANYVCSPFREPLSRYLNRHCAGTVGFFLEEHRLSNPMYNDLFFDILHRDDSRSLRHYLGGKECTVMLLNVCFERPLAIIRSEKQSPTTKAGSAHLNTYGINQWYSPTAQRKLEIARQSIEMKKKILSAKQQEEAKSKKALQSKAGDKKSSDYQAALKVHQGVRDAYERAQKEVEDSKSSYERQISTAFQQDSKQRPMTTSALELQTQGFRLVEVLTKLDPQYLSQHNDVVRAMRWLWRSRGRHYRLLHEEEMPPRYHNESLLLSRFLVSYSQACPEDTDVLFDLIRIFLQPFASIDFSFIKQFLVETMINVLTSDQKSQVMQRFLTLLSGDGSEETKILSCQMLIMPTLKQGNPKVVFGDASVRLFVKLLLNDGDVFGSKLTCELLNMVIILLDQMHEEVGEYRKDILKYIWGILKADNSNTKYIGYLAVSKFVAVFETPPKVILQVYRSLLRSHSSVERQNVREAMNLLLPNLHVRLEDPDLELALKYTVKVMHEVEDSLHRMAHFWDVIIRHAQLFERFKVEIVPYMKHAVSLLGSHLHSHPECRELSVRLAQLMIEWSDGGGAKSFSQKVADALVNIFVRIALLNAESKPNYVHHRVRAQALSLLQGIIACRKTCNIDPTHFLGTTLVLLSTKPPEKIETKDNKDSSPDDDAEGEKRKQAILRACVQICSILQCHDPTNEFLESNFCEILSRCFSFLTSTNDSKLSTMLENLVTRLLTDGTASSELISNVTVAVDNALIESRNRIEETACGFLAVSIVEKVTKVGEVFVDPFVSSLYMLAEKGVEKHMKEMEESTDTASLTKQGKFHQLSSTPTSGILGTAFGSHFKEVGSSKDMQMNDGDPRNQITIDAESLSTEMKALVTCIMLIGSSERAFQNNFGKGFVDILLALLNSSNSLSVLVTVVSIMGKWLLAEGQAPITKSERRAMLLGLARFDFERLSEVEARCLSDQICCFVLMAYGYDRSVIENYPFGVDRNQSMSIIRVSSPNGGLIGQEAFQKLFIACLLSANQYIRTLCTAIFGMRSSDCILVHGELSKLAIERGCRANDSIDIAGIPYREPEDILRQLLGSDFECIGGRLWTTVVLDVLLATSNHQGGVRARALGSVEADEEGAFASFMPLKSYDDDCAQDNKIELRYVDFDDGVYSSFVEVISAERSEQFCGKGRCIAAVRQIIHGDSRTFQSLFEHCIQAAWQSLPSNTARISLVQPLEALLAKPYHSQFTNAYNSPKVNAIQSMLRLLVKLRPIPVLDTFLLQSLSSDYNAIHEVLTYFECEYDALRKNRVDLDSSPHHLVKAIQRCYDALGERDVCTSISSAISSAQTKFALSLDMYGFVNESVDAYGALIDRAGDDTSLLPSEDELQIWEQRWVGSHKDMSQWSLIDEFATSHGEARLSLEAAWKTKNWEKVKSLFATPSVVALLEEGDQCAKMTEMYLAIQEGNLDEVDSIHAQIAQLCLYRWQLLPSISSGSQAHQSLLQQCTRLVELRESSQLLVETNAHVSRQTVPDLKTLLTAWKHRSPNLFEPISEWEDLFLWRSNIFDAITSNFGWVEPGTLATLHDRPHCCITLSRAARKQDLKEVSTFTMSSLGDSIMDVDTAFLKWREEVTTYQHSSENMLKGGLNLVNSANVSYFSDRQKAEVFRLKAYFLNELRDKPKANQAYCQAVQICPNHARSWQDWGDLCVSLSDATRKKLADDKADKKDLAKKASQYLSQAAGCYLEALRVDTSEQSRDRIPHCLSMLAADGRQYGSVCRTLQARGASTPAWCWLPWIPQLLSSLCRVEARAVKPILIGILKDHPQALYYSLRSFFLERRDVEKSMPDQKSDCASKEESDYQSSLKLAEIIMSSLRKTHPVLWNRLEVILDNLIVRFRPSYEAELLQTIIALINRTIKAEEKIHDNADDDNNEEKRMEYYEKTLSRIGDKFFSKSSSLSKKALHFQSRYGSLFDSDFGQSNLGSFEELIEKLQKWKALLERQVSRVPTKCKLSESSPALSWFSSQAPDMWAGACSSKSFSASNSRQDSLSSPQFYDSTRSSALKAARASSYSVLLAAQSEGIDGYAGGGAAAVEIPGQYSPTSAGVFDSRPIPEMHAKLVRFKQILEVTSTGSTKQHVHRITMIGSDGKEYKFLLQLAAPYSTRTDERSAQMQFIMGKTLRGDIRACRRGLIVRPNVVIPLAQRMRMSATQDSHQSLESILHCVQRSTIDLPTHFQEMVDERVSKIGDIDNDARLTAEKNAKLEVYTEICQQHMSSDNLTKYMMQILPSTESLCQFRKEFASHLAANSVLQYALAAVERTPTRFVLCNKTGQVLAHDLRSSYNHGLLENQAVPFRLTRNITEFIGPFLLDGVFVPSFVSISGAMSSRRNVLEPMLHLLLRDDVISWYTSKTSAANDKKIQDIELQLSDRVWKNVRFVQQRLDSCAPERVENAAEAIKGTVAPIDMKVRTLVDAACSVDRLSSMAPSYQAWL